MEKPYSRLLPFARTKMLPMAENNVARLLGVCFVRYSISARNPLFTFPLALKLAVEVKVTPLVPPARVMPPPSSLVGMLPCLVTESLATSSPPVV